MMRNFGIDRRVPDAPRAVVAEASPLLTWALDGLLTLARWRPAPWLWGGLGLVAWCAACAWAGWAVGGD